VLSRAAEAVYWMSRYVERAERTARLVEVNLQLALDLPAGMTEDWAPLLLTSGSEPLFRARFAEARRPTVVAFLAFDAENPSSVLSCLGAARENARSVREHLSPEMWEQLNRFYLMVRAASASAGEAPHELFAEIRIASHLFAGVTDATMSHGEGWRFGRLGRCLERADQTSRGLDLQHYLPPAAVEDVRWSAVLRSAGAYEMYRRRHGAIAATPVAEFLILDRGFPRSIQYAVSEAGDSLHALSGSPPGTFQNPAERGLGRLRAELDYARIDEIVATGLHPFLHGLRDRLNEVGDAISQTFFAPGPVTDAGEGLGV